jgi:predicted  nucleic acid-binding Zn-ribbon protein
MLAVIEKLLVLQDRDRRLSRLRQELVRIPIERAETLAKAQQSQKDLEGARAQIMSLESERKRIELEVESKKELIARYANQQFQTRKNEEFRALQHEIELNKKQIFELESQILEVMEKIEAAQKAGAVVQKASVEAKRLVDEVVAKLDECEANLQKDVAGLEAERATLAVGVDETTLTRYERLMKSKGDSVVVGIDRGVCAGCHMRLSRQIIVDCRSEQNITTCMNCGRILYFSPEMDTTSND